MNFRILCALTVGTLLALNAQADPKREIYTQEPVVGGQAGAVVDLKSGALGAEGTFGTDDLSTMARARSGDAQESVHIGFGYVPQQGPLVHFGAQRDVPLFAGMPNLYVHLGQRDLFRNTPLVTEGALPIGLRLKTEQGFIDLNAEVLGLVWDRNTNMIQFKSGANVLAEQQLTPWLSALAAAGVDMTFGGSIGSYSQKGVGMRPSGELGARFVVSPELSFVLDAKISDNVTKVDNGRGDVSVQHAAEAYAGGGAKITF